MKEEDVWGDIAPRNFDDDTRTAMIAAWSARQAARGLAEEIGAVLAEMLAGLREAKVLDDAAAATVMLRWDEAFKAWRRGDGDPAKDVLMRVALTEELAWCLPDLAPQTGARPARHGRKRRPASPRSV